MANVQIVHQIKYVMALMLMIKAIVIIHQRGIIVMEQISENALINIQCIVLHVMLVSV